MEQIFHEKCCKIIAPFFRGKIGISFNQLCYKGNSPDLWAAQGAFGTNPESGNKGGIKTPLQLPNPEV